jgi:hypothetical protein
LKFWPVEKRWAAPGCSLFSNPFLRVIHKKSNYLYFRSKFMLGFTPCAADSKQR